MSSVTLQELMTRDFAIIHPDMPVVEATAKLIKKEMLGGPVVDSEGKLVGWISEQECLHVTIQVLYYNQRVATVGDIMQKNVVTVAPSDDPLNLAQRMLQAKPKNYPVVDANGLVLGVVSRRHLLKLLDAQLAKQARRL